MISMEWAHQILTHAQWDQSSLNHLMGLGDSGMQSNVYISNTHKWSKVQRMIKQKQHVYTTLFALHDANVQSIVRFAH